MEASPEVGVVVLTVCIAVLCTVGILSNAVLILFYVRRPVMRTSTNVYLVHKAAVDLVSLVTFPAHLLEVVVSPGSGLDLGEWPCKLVASLETLCMIVSANLLFGVACDRLTAVTSPGDGHERTVSKARNHVMAAWVYSLLIVLPVVSAAGTVVWSPAGDPALTRPTCGYRWPAGDQYHSMYFGSLLVILYAGHYLVYACFVYLAWRQVQGSKEAFRSRYDTVQRCRAVAGVLVFNFAAYFTFWVQHFYVMIRSVDQTNMPHIPGALADPLSAAASLGVYLAAGSNLLLYGRSMDQWRCVLADAFHCRCGTSAGRGAVFPLSGEDAVAVIDVTAAADPPQETTNANSADDTNHSSTTRLNRAQRSADEELEVQDIDV